MCHDISKRVCSNPCEFGLVVGARSTMLDECYNDTSGNKEVTGSIIPMCKESHRESFNLNPSLARSGSSLGHYFCNQKKKTNLVQYIFTTFFFYQGDIYNILAR